MTVFHMVVKWHLHGAADKMGILGLINGAVSKRMSVKRRAPSLHKTNWVFINHFTTIRNLLSVIGSDASELFRLL